MATKAKQNSNMWNFKYHAELWIYVKFYYDNTYSISIYLLAGSYVTPFFQIEICRPEGYAVCFKLYLGVTHISILGSNNVIYMAYGVNGWVGK